MLLIGTYYILFVELLHFCVSLNCFDKWMFVLLFFLLLHSMYSLQNESSQKSE